MLNRSEPVTFSRRNWFIVRPAATTTRSPLKRPLLLLPPPTLASASCSRSHLRPLLPVAARAVADERLRPSRPQGLAAIAACTYTTLSVAWRCR